MLVNEAADANGLPNEANKLRHDLRNLPQGKRIVMNQPLILGQIITLMLQSSNHRHYSLSDLEWMVLPPLKVGQVALAESKPDQSGCEPADGCRILGLCITRGRQAHFLQPFCADPASSRRVAFGGHSLDCGHGRRHERRTCAR